MNIVSALLVFAGLLVPSFEVPAIMRRSPLYTYHYRPGKMREALINHGFRPGLLNAQVDGFASTPEPGRNGQCPRVDPADPWVGIFSVRGGRPEYYLIVDCTAPRDLSYQVYDLHLGAEIDAGSAIRHRFYWSGSRCEYAGWCGHAPLKVLGFIRYRQWQKGP
jgi:hypothetical protein